MTMEPSPGPITVQARQASSPPWLYARPLWAGLSIITMWLAVLFVGVFGGDFVVDGSDGITQFPVVAFVLPFVLFATLSVVRRGFTSTRDEPRHAPDMDTQAPQEATTEPSALRVKAA